MGLFHNTSRFQPFKSTQKNSVANACCLIKLMPHFGLGRLYKMSQVLSDSLIKATCIMYSYA